MTNNLIFSNGAVFAMCDIGAADAPRMMGGGWRQWHIEASNADAAAALESGVARREYESVVGVDVEGKPVTELLVEDLTAYVVPGSVCDHMDGTVTVFARRMSELERTQNERELYADSLYVLGVDTANTVESVTKRITGIREVVAAADLTEKHETIVDMPVRFCAEWMPGMELAKGRLVEYNAVKYLVLQPVTAQEHQPPDMANGAMLAVYKPYQGRERYTWLYGEYTEVGFTRYDGAELYVCTADPGANIYPPSQVPACWEVVQ